MNLVSAIIPNGGWRAVFAAYDPNGVPSFDNSAQPSELFGWKSTLPEPTIQQLESLWNAQAAKPILDYLESIADWSVLQAALESSSAYQRIAQRADSSSAVAFRVTQLMVLVSVTRNRSRLQQACDRMASSPGFNQADRDELNQILSNAGFTEQVA